MCVGGGGWGGILDRGPLYHLISLVIDHEKNNCRYDNELEVESSQYNHHPNKLSIMYATFVCHLSMLLFVQMS